MPATRDPLRLGADDLVRCSWCGDDPMYVAYHDHEWGRPVHDEVRLFEKLCLEGFQSGLAWITILRKREAFREAFAGFDPEVVARFSEAEVERLVANAGIVRHRGKIMATINNAARLCAMRECDESLVQLVWLHAPAPRGERVTSLGEIESSTPGSTRLSNALRARGFRFVGPTTVYAFMQSMGLVDDHVHGCFVPLATSTANDSG